MTPARREPPGPGEPDKWQEHWARVLDRPDPDPCCLCDRTARSADCQRVGRLPAMGPGQEHACGVVFGRAVTTQTGPRQGLQGLLH